MKKLLKVSMVVLVIAALAFAFTACRDNDDSGTPAATTVAPATEATTPATTPADDATTDAPTEVVDVTPDLITSPPGELRVYRDFTAANLNMTIMNPHQMSGSTDFDGAWFTRALLLRETKCLLAGNSYPKWPLKCQLSATTVLYGQFTCVKVCSGIQAHQLTHTVSNTATTC